MMTRSIVGRFLILAVLLVSLGVIAQAALIITRGSGKTVAKASAAPVGALSTAVAALTTAPAAAPMAAPPTAVAAVTPAPVAAPAAAQASPAAQPAPTGGDASPIRVVYPGPLGDTGAPPRKFVAAAPAMPTPAAPQAATAATAAPAAPAAAPAPATPAPAKPAAVVVASANADTQPTADAPPAAKGGINLNSASVDALNHLGGGHIGQTIVQHRPYHSVEDLVKKRVVRRSVYEQIKNQVAAD